MRYFIAGNTWLFLSVVVFLLRQTERTGPLRVSFLGIGSWLSPAEYNGVVLFILLVGCACFFVGWKQNRRG